MEHQNVNINEASAQEPPLKAKSKRAYKADPIAQAVTVLFFEGPQIYLTDSEAFEALRDSGCQHLYREEEKSRKAVRQVLVQNSKKFGRRPDGTFYLFRRIRDKRS